MVIVAAADAWRAWAQTILDEDGGDAPALRATQALSEAALRDGRHAMPRGWKVSDATVEDLVQDVLATSWQKILEADSPRALFMVAVKRKAIDRHRRVDKREASLDAVDGRSLVGSPTAKHEARAEVARVVHFLEASLSPRDLRVFQARAVLGLSSKEVADQEGLSHANVD